MTDIPLNAQVICTDGFAGRSTYIIIDRATKKVTHVVVREADNSHKEYLVPIASIAETDPATIRVDCTNEELRALKPFVEKNMLTREITHIIPSLAPIWGRPCRTSEKVYVPVEVRHIPKGESAVQNGAHARIGERDIGRIVDFLMDPVTDEITRMVVREGHLWRQKEVAIPASQIECFSEKVVSIKQS